MKRMQMFVNGVLSQAERHKVPLELVLVEWNPPSDKPPLREALVWPKYTGYADVKIIQVSELLHKRFQHADRLPLYQMIAKNVGIRRSRSPFVLATNIDILFSDELFDFFAAGRLKEGHMYRTDRYDVNENIPAELSFDDQLEYCRNNVVRLNHFRGSVSLIDGNYTRHCADDIEEFPEQMKLPKLHTNACGDFQLMANRHWLELRGYPEFDMYSFHIDSIMESMAHYGGAPELCLGEPYRIYHIEHQSGWTPEAQKDGSFETRYATQKIRKMTDQELNDFETEMFEKRQAVIVNQENWGLADDTLPEFSVY